MIIWIIRLLVVAAGPVLGYLQVSRDARGILIGTAMAIFVILLEIIIEQVALDTMVSGGIGIVLGIILGRLIDYAITQMENPIVDKFYVSYALLIKIVVVYVCMVLAIRKKDQLDLLDKDIFPGRRLKGKVAMKVLDTSALIDGRIGEICETKFIEGVLVIPGFVLDELQAVADSADATKRARGRRGLDVAKKLKDNKNITVKIFKKDYPKIPDVDGKIVKLAGELESKIITSDYNLNKTASAQGVAILNVNELSNAVKPPVLPGEALSLFILKEGKERSQGVAYLDDGTMVVVDYGKNYIGQKVEAIVSSILQTSAGRMIFAKIK